MQTFVGSHWVLANLSWWGSILILWILTIGILPVGRLYFEGYGYNVAWSSKYGDWALIMCIVIAAFILQRPGHLPSWLISGTYHIVCGALAVAAGILLVTVANPLTREQVMDNYHNFFVVALLFYLLATTLPVVYWGGMTGEKVIVLCLLLLWAGLVVVDFQTGRSDQRSWLAKQSITFPKK